MGRHSIYWAIVLIAVFSSNLVTAQPGDLGHPLRSTSGGAFGGELRTDYLGDFGLRLERNGRPEAGRVTFETDIQGAITLLISPGQFGGFEAGSLNVAPMLAFHLGNRTVVLDELVLLPGHRAGRSVIDGHDAAGNHLITLTHLHAMLANSGTLVMIRHADLVAEAELARQLGLPALAGMVIGDAWLDLPVGSSAPAARFGPSDTGREDLSCEGRPFWPQDGHAIDIALTGMQVAQYQGSDPETGWIKLAPSATLKNVSTGDVPWIAKFESNPAYPHTPPDQHPYLVWSLYRWHKGEIEQLGMSGVKHAFNTINSNCDLSCNYLNGDILGPGCEDVYGASTNDRGTAMGPRDEVIASHGLFNSTGSFFDSDGDGKQDTSSREFENRLLIDPSGLLMDGADYFLSAWYVVQCDVDIFNSMGYRQVDPQPVNDGWSFNLIGEFTEGPTVRASLTGGGHGVWGSHELFTVPSAAAGGSCLEHMPQGHAALLARSEAVANGQYRYHYALQNFDLDRGIGRLIVPLAAGASVFGAQVIAATDTSHWTVTIESDRVVFESEGQEIPWLALYSFVVVTDATPASGQLTLGLGGDVEPQSMMVSAIVPGNGLVFQDRFEEYSPVQ